MEHDIKSVAALLRELRAEGARLEYRPRHLLSEANRWRAWEVVHRDGRRLWVRDSSAIVAHRRGLVEFKEVAT